MHKQTKQKKQTSTMRVFQFEEPMLQAIIYFVFDFEHEEFVAWLCSSFNQPGWDCTKFNGKCCEVMEDGIQKCNVIALPSFPRNSRQLGYLAHEVNHAVEHILSVRGIPLGGEPPAYLAAYIFSKCMDAPQFARAPY